MLSNKDYFFVSQGCSPVITTDSEEEATAQLRETVRRPQEFRLAQVDEV